MEEILLTEGIDVENRRQNIPTFDNGRGSSFIDLTLSRDIPGEIRNWSVKRSEDSDHNYIHCELNLNSEKNETQYWKETDWEAYAAEVQRTTADLYRPKIFTPSNLDRMAEEATTVLREAL